MNHIFTIIKKELKRFFTDKRMLITLFVPGILIFVLYSFMGSFMESALTNDPNHEYIVYIDSNDDSVKNLLETTDYNIKFNKATIEDKNNIKGLFENESADLYISFSDDFFEAINENLSPNIDIFYNSSNTESSAIYQYYLAKLTPGSINNIDYKYKINMQENIQYDFATQEESSIVIITMMLPYLLIIFLFTGCLAISSESIAGEKERGTIAALLVTPVKRSHIATGKILALSITALASSLVSFLGLILSLPKLMQGANGITLSMYGIDTFLQIFAIILITVILFTVILSIISTYARSVKEASQLSSVVMIIVMLAGVSSMVGIKSVASNHFAYIIPIYNCVQCMSGIFSLQLNPINFLLTIISNIIYIALGIKILAIMFNSEKIMFNK